MRLIKALLALLFIVFGVLFGALNRDPVRIDLGFRSFENFSLGTSLLLAVLLGALLAGLVLTAGVIWPLRHRLRRRSGVAEPQVTQVHE
jgi:putative membrane protein